MNREYLLSHPDISSFINPNRGDLASRKTGRTRDYTREICIYVPCLKCGKSRWISRSNYQHGYQGDFCRLCAAKVKRSGPNHPRWTERQIRGGYVYLHLLPNHPLFCMASDDGRIPEHRLMMAEQLDRPLSTEEIVHHINGNKGDNRLENLSLDNRKNHNLSEHFLRLKERVQFLEKSNLLLWILLFSILDKR